MSRTDKDTPSWYRAEWYEPNHRCGWISWHKWDPENKRIGTREWHFRGECDLPAEPAIGDTGWVPSRRRAQTNCVWVAEWNDSQTRYRKHKREWRKTEWNGPQRMRERVAARRIISGDIDYEYPEGRTRHSVLWNLF
jgi:hypothetical protein